MHGKPLQTHYRGSRRLPLARRVGAFLFGAFILAGTQPAAAQNVPVCDALTLYGNAALERLCKSLSPTTQNLWVCGLTDTATDVHTTFNLGTALHITVRTPRANPTCQGNANLTGHWPNNLAIAANQPNNICNVDIQNWVNRLNAVNRLPAGNQTLCTAPFIEAVNRQILDHGLAQTYINTCRQQNCP